MQISEHLNQPLLHNTVGVKITARYCKYNPVFIRVDGFRYPPTLKTVLYRPYLSEHFVDPHINFSIYVLCADHHNNDKSAHFP